MNKLREIYDEHLINSLIYTLKYNNVALIPGIKEYILNKEFIIKYLNYIIENYGSQDSYFNDSDYKKNIIIIVNFFRGQFEYKNDEEKEEIYSLYNECIRIANRVPYVFGKFVFLRNKKGILPLCISEYSKELASDFVFTFIHYYLSDDKIFETEYLPNVIFTFPYLYALDYLLKEYPSLWSDIEFIKKTKIIIENCLKYEFISIPDLPEERKKVYIKYYKKAKNMILKRQSS